MKKLKGIPPKYHNMLQSNKETDPNKSDFDLIVPSAQFWNDLSESEKNQLRQIVSDEGKDMEDYLHEMRQMLPFTPKGR